MEAEANKITKQPSYRFAGYTEAWAEKKLGEVADRYDNLRVPVSANERISGSTPYYGANGIQDYVDGYTHDGEFILIAEDGASDLKDYPVQYVNGKVWVNNHAHVIRGKHNLIKNLFLLFAVKRINIEPFLVGGGRAKLNSDVMMKLPLRLPSLSEQTAIGSFFQDIDQLISLQQRKLEVLKEQKKTYLKLLFPAKGQTKPALRFAGFDDEWKEVKLGKVGEIQTGNTPPTNEEDNYEKNGFPWVTPTDINSLVLNTTSKQLSEVGKSKARIAKAGSILVTCIASIGKNTLVRTDSAFNQQINSLTPSEKYSSYFLLTQSEIWSRYMLSVAGAGTMQIINKSDFSNLKTIVPTLPEQEVIGSFFQDLDKAIAKQEEKVNQLKESKQTFLKKMFI